MMNNTGKYRTGHRISNIGHRMSNIEHRTSNYELRYPDQKPGSGDDKPGSLNNYYLFIGNGELNESIFSDDMGIFYPDYALAGKNEFGFNGDCHTFL